MAGINPGIRYPKWELFDDMINKYEGARLSVFFADFRRLPRCASDGCISKVGDLLSLSAFESQERDFHPYAMTPNLFLMRFASALRTRAPLRKRSSVACTVNLSAPCPSREGKVLLANASPKPLVAPVTIESFSPKSGFCPAIYFPFFIQGQFCYELDRECKRRDWTYLDHLSEPIVGLDRCGYPCVLYRFLSLLDDVRARPTGGNTQRIDN